MYLLRTSVKTISFILLNSPHIFPPPFSPHSYNIFTYPPTRIYLSLFSYQKYSQWYAFACLLSWIRHFIQTFVPASKYPTPNSFTINLSIQKFVSLPLFTLFPLLVSLLSILEECSYVLTLYYLVFTILSRKTTGETKSLHAPSALCRHCRSGG